MRLICGPFVAMALASSHPAAGQPSRDQPKRQDGTTLTREWRFSASMFRTGILDLEDERTRTFPQETIKLEGEPFAIYRFKPPTQMISFNSDVPASLAVGYIHENFTFKVDFVTRVGTSGVLNVSKHPGGVVVLRREPGAPTDKPGTYTIRRGPLPKSEPQPPTQVVQPQPPTTPAKPVRKTLDQALAVLDAPIKEGGKPPLRIRHYLKRGKPYQRKFEDKHANYFAIVVVPRWWQPPTLKSGAVCENRVSHVPYRVDEQDLTFPLSHAAYAYKIGSGYTSTASPWEQMCITVVATGDYESNNVEIFIWR